MRLHMLRTNAKPLFTCLIALAISAIGAPSQAAAPGLPFTEDFTDSSLEDSSQTDANWSPEEEAVFLQWRDHVRAGQANWPSTGTAVGGSDTNVTTSIALGDLDGDGDLDVVAGDAGQTIKVYLNDGDGAPFDSIATGAAVGASDTDNTWSIALGDVDGDLDFFKEFGTD